MYIYSFANLKVLSYLENIPNLGNLQVLLNLLIVPQNQDGSHR